MSTPTPEWIGDAWETGYQAAMRDGKERTIRKIKNGERPDQWTYEWWRRAAALAWLGGQEVVAHGKSEEG